ncbi:hypothetical protein BaRGS_00016701, partial [Batillaria attramentaria]
LEFLSFGRALSRGLSSSLVQRQGRFCAGCACQSSVLCLDIRLGEIDDKLWDKAASDAAR